MNDASVSLDKYDQMLALADAFDSYGTDLRTRARLGSEILGDDDVRETAALNERTFAEAEEDIRAATTGKNGLLTRSVELDADALVIRATVLTYRWIDELQQAAYQTLGTIAGRAIGYLAPEVALGGAIVSAGLIETEAHDRDDIAAYLNELAENNPELMDHISGGGGLLDGLPMGSLLTAGVFASEQGPLAARAGLRAIGAGDFPTDALSAFRDAAGSLVEIDEVEQRASVSGTEVPRSFEDLMTRLSQAGHSTSVQRVGEARYIAYLPGHRGEVGRLRLVGASTPDQAGPVTAAIEAAIRPEDAKAQVMLVGAASGGTLAAEIAANMTSDRFVVDQVITAGAPAAQVPAIPTETRMISFEDRADPITLLGSLINAPLDNRLTVVFDGSHSPDNAFVAGGRAADLAKHSRLRSEIQRLQELGYLTG